MEQIITDREAGMSLAELMVVMAIGAVLLAAGVTAFAHRPYARHSALSSFASMLDRAHALALQSGNGATIIKFEESDAGLGSQGYFFLLCKGRPIPGTSFGPCSQSESLPGDITALPPLLGSYASEWAIYVDTRGTISLGPWTSGYMQTQADTPTTVSSEPSCPAGDVITLEFTGGEATQTHTVDCSTGIYQ